MNEVSLDLIVPCHNEQESLPDLFLKIGKTFEDIQWKLILVNDGSTDDTGEMIENLTRNDSRVLGIHLSRNFGHQAAISAGLAHSKSDCVVIMDADGQDPIELIPKMLDHWREGYQVVYGIRARRQSTIILGTCYKLYYYLLQSISDVKMPLHAGDFCLIDAKVVAALLSYSEKRKYWRGLRCLAGFKQIGVPYDRPGRKLGKSKYSILKLMGLAADGIFNMSFFPLRLIAYVGALMAFFSIMGACLVIVWHITDYSLFGMRPKQVAGWTSLFTIMTFLSGIHFLFLGVIGEYVARVYVEVKNRPEYHISKTTQKDDSTPSKNLREKETAQF